MSFLVDETGATLSLFDYNDGGWPTAALTPPVLLGQVTVTAGVNDGWQRLSLTVSNGTADGRFGGTYGAPDGTLISGGTSTGRRGVYVGYREFVTDNTTTRPFTCDGLQIVQCSAAASRLFGSAVAGSAGTLPTITASGDPRLGASITVDAAGLIPNDTAWWLVGFERTTPIDLPGLTPSGFGIWVDAFDCPGLPTDGAGASTFPLTVPSSVAFCGFELALQAFQIDTQLTAAVPVFHTQGIVLHTGN